MGPAAAKRIELLNYALGGLAVAVGLLVLTQPQVLGLLCGALLGALNFSAIRRLVEKQVAAQESGSGAGAALIFPKMLALIAAVAAAIYFLPIAPAFLAAGFSIFLISIAIESVRFMTSPAKEPQ